MDIICAGMYRSGSTWQYQVASRIARDFLGGEPLGFVNGEQYTLDPFSHLRVLKTHQPHEQFSQAIAAGHARAIYVMRDLRDVVFSAMRFWGLPFEDVTAPGGTLELCMANDAFWQAQPGVLVQRYRQNVVDPAAAARQIAGFLGVEFGWPAAARLADEFSFTRNRELARVSPAPPRETLLHPGHVEDGRIGGWRVLATQEQRGVLARVCGAWLIERGYELDVAWAENHEHEHEPELEQTESTS